MAGWEQQIMVALQAVFDASGWLGVAALLAFESATGITPSEVVLGLAGWILLAAHGAPPAMILLAGLWAALGSLAGTALLYWLVRLGGRPLVYRSARWLRLDPRYIPYAERQFHRWGPSLVLFGRILPGIRILVTIPAGLARMPFPKFLLYSFIGAYVWCTVLIGLGYTVGHEWPLIVQFFMQLARQYLPFLLAASAALAALGLLGQRALRRRILAQTAPVRSDAGPSRSTPR